MLRSSESTPLLRPLETQTRVVWRDYKHILSESKVLLRMSAPVILTYMLQNSFQAVSVLIVGRLSESALATAAFAYMFATATGMLIALGGTTAIDTLASASFTGSADRHEVGVILQRALIILSAFYVPVAGLWMGSAPLFKLLGQDTQVSDDSARFLTAFIPGGLGYIYYESLKKYLQAQGIVKPTTYITCVSALLNAALNYVLVHTFQLGLLGAPLATGLAFWTAFLLLLLYTRHHQHHLTAAACWGSWSRRSLAARPLAAFARLAALGVLHIGSEWWAFEAVALAAGRLPGTAALAAQSVLMTSDQVFNTIPFGVGVAASARVGNLLGRGDGRAAAKAAQAAAGLSVGLGLALLAALLAVKDGYARLFGADDAVVRLVARVMPYVAAFQVADGLNASCGGVLRGMGKQHVGAVVNLFAYYCFALPLGIYLAFYRRWSLDGLWIGLCCALYTAGAVQWIIIARTKWEGEVRKTRDRLDRAAQDGVNSQV